MLKRRKIVKIDEEKCDGCGQCVNACAEGAIQIVEGKARLVKEIYCDGLGACLDVCPRDAISIDERPAEEFDPEAVKQHLAQRSRCPGAVSMAIDRGGPAPYTGDDEGNQSRLGNWPVQLRLVPVDAPYFHEARLLVTADCVPFAFADFHRRFLGGRVLLVGCPKLDNVEFYRQKLAEIFKQNEIRDVEVVHMEVPCCFGLVRVVQLALKDAGKDIPLTLTKVGVRGALCETGKAEAKCQEKQK